MDDLTFVIGVCVGSLVTILLGLSFHYNKISNLRQVIISLERDLAVLKEREKRDTDAVIADNQFDNSGKRISRIRIKP